MWSSALGSSPDPQHDVDPRTGPDPVTAAALEARDGDPDAARRFVAATYADVGRLLGHLTDRTAAEDLVQETYERAFGALARFRAEASARTWLLSIARRVAADHLRRSRRRPSHPVPPEEADPGLAGAGSDHAERVALWAVLDALAPERREAFVLTQLVGLGYADAAEVVGCPIGTVRSRVARARADLISALGHRIDTPGDGCPPDPGGSPS